MDQITTILAIVSLLGSALIAGAFFAFSTFVMKALARLPEQHGVAAMQSINVVVLNPWFLGAFIGTAVTSLAMAVLAARAWSAAPAPFYLAATALYVVGTFLVTGTRNVPLNDALAAVAPDDAEAAAVWHRYLREWTFWNHVRTVAALLAALCYCLGLLNAAA